MAELFSHCSGSVNMTGKRYPDCETVRTGRCATVWEADWSQAARLERDYSSYRPYDQSQSSYCQHGIGITGGDLIEN